MQGEGHATEFEQPKATEDYGQHPKGDVNYTYHLLRKWAAMAHAAESSPLPHDAAEDRNAVIFCCQLCMRYQAHQLPRQ